MPTDVPNEERFTYPGLYCIRVSRKVRNDLKDYFEGIEKAEVAEVAGREETSLTANIRDQAELIGLINMLYNWQHDLISVHLENVGISSTLIE